MASVRLLGPVALLDGHQELAIGGAKPRAVLALLALAAPRVVSVDALVQSIWGDDPPASARNAVQVYVSGLRRLLGADSDALAWSGDGYQLVGDRLAVDAAAFEQTVAEGRSALRAGDPGRATALLSSALNWWVGAPLGGLEKLPFHGSATDGLIDTKVSALVDGADGLIRIGRPRDAIGPALRATRVRPFDEHAWEVLARAQYHAGRQADALATCRQLRDLLDDELGVDPSPELAELELQILRHSVPVPWEQAEQGHREEAASPDDEPALPPLPDPFVGRDDLVAQTLEALGGDRVVTLTGMGGIGKTSIATASALELARNGGVVRWCPLEDETGSEGALEQICRALRVSAEPDHWAGLGTVDAQVVCVLDNVEQIAGIEVLVDELRRRCRFALLVTSRRRLRVERETCVVVGPLSLEPSHTGAPSPAAELLAARMAQTQHPGRRLDPSGAATGTDEALVVSAAQLTRVCRLVDGVPLALELAANRTRVLPLAQLADRLERKLAASLGSGRQIGKVGRQAGVEVAVMTSWECLPPAASTLVFWMAAFDGRVSIDLLDAVASHAVDGDLLDALDDVLASGFGDQDADGRVALRPVIREVIDAQPDREVVDRALVEHVEELARRAARPDAADEFLDRLTADLSSFEGAVRRAASRGWADSAAELVLGLRTLWLRNGRIVEGRELMERVRAMGGHTAAHATRLAVVVGVFGSYLNDIGAQPLLTSGLVELDAMGAPIDRFHVNGWCCLAALEAHHGQPDAARLHGQWAAALADRSGDPSLVSLARQLAGHVASYTGDFETAAAVALAGVASARAANNRYELVQCMVSAVNDLMELGRFTEALALSDEVFGLIRDTEVGTSLTNVLRTRGAALVAVGRLPEGRGCLVESLRITRDRYPDSFIQASILSSLAGAAAKEHDDQSAIRLWGAAKSLCDSHGIALATVLSADDKAGLDAVRRRVGPGLDDQIAAASITNPMGLVHELITVVDPL